MNKLIYTYGTDNYLRVVPFMGIRTIKIVCQNIFIISVVKNYFTTENVMLVLGKGREYAV